MEKTKKHTEGSLVKVYNAEAYRTSNKHYYYLQADNNRKYLFTKNELGDAEERARKNTEDYRDLTIYSVDNLVDIETSKFGLDDLGWICCGFLLGVSALSAAFYIFT